MLRRGQDDHRIPTAPRGSLARLRVELRRPDGGKTATTMTLAHESLYPPPQIKRWGCIFGTLGKEEIPVGTEVWCEDEIFLDPGYDS
jgi:hypothetical protein